MDITNKNIGNLLYQMSDKEVKEVFEQYAHKLGFDKCDQKWEMSMMHWINDIIMCNHFDTEGNSMLVDEDITSDKFWDKLND